MKKALTVIACIAFAGTLKAQQPTEVIYTDQRIVQSSTADPASNFTYSRLAWKYNNAEQGYVGFGSNNGTLFLHNGIGNLALGTYGSAKGISFYTLTGEKMWLSPDGMFGIGTNVPETKLDVAGRMRGIGQLFLRSNQTSSTELVLEKPNGAYYSIGCDALSMNFYNHSTGNVFLKADANNNIGIGTSDTYGNKLAVNGSILAEKVKVKLRANWPDYVFEPAYQLPNLQALEAYVRTHKHLPDVPSAREVAEKGLDLGDTQATLLKKIEELTLLLIEQNKKLEDQEKRLKALEKQ